ncbi:MAG: serine/threonine protein kinase [Acidobacteria bacterium]|nr:serine/threonine protein kinase [Acidobacteriota bacterium]
MMSSLLYNRYKIVRPLGSGGAGQTYLAEDTHIPENPRRVVKQLKPKTSDPFVYQIIKDRFEREAAVLERLGKDNGQIPTLYDYFPEGQNFYLVQDWVDGKTLGDEVRDHGLFGANMVCQFLISLLSVLEDVHAQGIIHRDIKPANVMVRARDRKPVLIDFGAVKEIVSTIVDARGNPVSTVIIGTPGYMPLEQAQGDPVFASDLYSLGRTAIFLLTGMHPQQMQSSTTGPLSWRQHARGVNPRLCDVLDKATQRLAEHRYQSATEMRAAVAAAAQVGRIQIDVPTPTPPPPQPPAPGPRRKLVYGAAALLTLAVLGGVSLAGWSWFKAAMKMNADELARPLRASCVLYNDDAGQPTVNVRADCDKKSCDGDSSTIIKEYPNNTEVRVNRDVKVKSKKDYYWMQLVIVGSGETAWVSSAKIRCNGEQLKLP